MTYGSRVRARPVRPRVPQVRHATANVCLASVSESCGAWCVVCVQSAESEHTVMLNVRRVRANQMRKRVVRCAAHDAPPVRGDNGLSHHRIFLFVHERTASTDLLDTTEINLRAITKRGQDHSVFDTGDRKEEHIPERPRLAHDGAGVASTENNWRLSGHGSQ